MLDSLVWYFIIQHGFVIASRSRLFTKHSMHNYVIICEGMGLDLSYHHTLFKYLLPKSSNHHLQIQSSSIVKSHVSFQLNAQDHFSFIATRSRAKKCAYNSLNIQLMLCHTIKITVVVLIDSLYVASCRQSKAPGRCP